MASLWRGGIVSRYNMRFRRSIGLGKFFRLNFGKRGVSASAGPRGARKTWHTSGRRTTTFGLPGSGISWTKSDSPSTKNSTEQYTGEPVAREKHSHTAASDLDLILAARDELEERDQG